MRINDSERFVNLFLIIIILLPLVHGTSLLLVVGLLFYLFLTKIEGFNIKKSETEIILFSTFFIAWTLFLIFKKAILMHGPAVIWQNLPESILNLKFATTNILNYFNYIGIIPLIFGIWSVHRHVIKTRDIDSYKLISFVVSIFLLLILKLVEPTLALSYIGIILVIISSKIFLHISEYIKKTKAPRFRFFIFSFIIFLFIFTSLITTIDLSEGKITNLPSQNEINALEWLKTQGKEGEVVLASLKYGHAINYVAKKRNVFDNNFISMDNVETKMKDVKYLYHSKSLIEVVRLINKYDIKYIILSKQEKKDYKIEDLSYKNNHICFKLIYDKDQIKIYEFLDCDTGQDDE